ncbi:MAG: hypothetical protein ACRDTJ_25470, partial [Pseudonocardiaceae bacterium]
VDMHNELREEDLLRHLADLVTRSYEGAESWPERLALFHRAVELLDPVVRRVLDEANATFLEATGQITGRNVEHDDGGVAAHWELSWPRQREATSRNGGPVAPVQVIAWFGRSFNHPHLRGSTAGDWPLQVISTDDATRQAPIVRAIVEAELHQRIFEGRWPVMPVAVTKYGLPPG